MAKTEKLDLYKQHKAEYAASKTKPQLVDVGPAKYLTIRGEGEPAGEVFQAKIQAMYSVAFTIKMTWKFAGKGDYKVCHLEGLWWADDADTANGFMALPRDKWQWKVLIRVPEFIGPGELRDAKEVLRKKDKPPEFEQVKLETIKEGRCVQMLHVGPYATEPETIAGMTKFVEASGLSLHGLHHEIYLSDPRRVAPERLRTILRHPVRPPS